MCVCKFKDDLFLTHLYLKIVPSLKLYSSDHSKRSGDLNDAKFLAVFRC